MYLFIIAALASFIFYTLDQISKMAMDVKYMRNRIDKISPSSSSIATPPTAPKQATPTIPTMPAIPTVPTTSTLPGST